LYIVLRYTVALRVPGSDGRPVLTVRWWGSYLNSAAVRIFTMHTLDDKPDIRAQSMNELIRKLAAGAIRPLIHARLPLKDARRAHEMIEAREVIGKVLLKP